MASNRSMWCCDCGETFVFTASEQEFFKEKKLKNLPKRCPNCRVLMKIKRTGKIFDATTSLNCAACGALTVVPFKAKGHKPVYCATCFAGAKQAPVIHPPLSS